MGGYPMGAFEDSNAPYNYIDVIPDKYDEQEALDAINNEIEESDDTFVEWLTEHYPIDGNSMTFEADVQTFADQTEVKDAYFDFRHDAVINNIIKEHYE